MDQMISGFLSEKRLVTSQKPCRPGSAGAAARCVPHHRSAYMGTSEYGPELMTELARVSACWKSACLLAVFQSRYARVKYTLASKCRAAPRVTRPKSDCVAGKRLIAWFRSSMMTL